MGKREEIKGKPGAWLERGEDGQFKDWHDIKKSLAQDRARDAKTKVKPGYGHRGDIPRKTVRKRTYIKPHTRVINGKRVRVRGHYRKM